MSNISFGYLAGVHWIDLAGHRDRCRVLKKAVMNLLGSQERFCTVELFS